MEVCWTAYSNEMKRPGNLNDESFGMETSSPAQTTRFTISYNSLFAYNKMHK